MTHTENNWHGIDLWKSSFKGLKEIILVEELEQSVSEICHNNGTLVFEASGPAGHAIRVYNLTGNKYYYIQIKGPNTSQEAIEEDERIEKLLQNKVDSEWDATINKHSFRIPL